MGRLAVLLLAAGALACTRADANPGARRVGAAAGIVLEPTEVAGLGRLDLPRGFVRTGDKRWAVDLGDGDEIAIRWEPHGVADLDEAIALSAVLVRAGVVVHAVTIGAGVYEVERVRARDGHSFVVRLGPDWYLTCAAPAARTEVCRAIVRSRA